MKEPSPGPNDRGGAAKRFEVYVGPLGAHGPITLAMPAPDTLTISADGVGYPFKASLKRTDKPTDYVTVAAAQVCKCPALTADMLARLNPSSSRSMEVHRIVAVVALGADFRLDGGNIAAHHSNLNGGDNRASNLMVLAQRTHDRVHRAIDADIEGYLASLADDPTGMAFLATAAEPGSTR